MVVPMGAGPAFRDKLFDGKPRIPGHRPDRRVYVIGTHAPLTVQYGYDKASNRTSMTDPQTVPTTYGYDTLNRLHTLTYNNQTPNFVFGYDALSRRNSLTRPNSVDTTYGYDPVSRLTSVLHKLGTTVLDGASYTYDNAGNRKTRTDKRTSVTLTYGYDNIYQLKTAKQGTTTKESYTYDLVGNRLSSLGVNPYNYNSSNELTSIPSGSYTYDNNGNRKSDPAGAQYSWDYENRLTQVILPGTGGTVNFKYDPFGRRIQKAFTQNGTTTTTDYLYDGVNILETTDQSGNVLTRYVDSLNVDEPLSEVNSGTTSYYEQDGLGSVGSLSNASGALANTYTYDSYGKLTASTGTLANPFRHTARESDTETGYYYYRHRYYDPNIGRFLSEDPLGFESGSNFYVYVSNDPATFFDPSGLQQQGAPVYNPGTWNDAGHVGTNNCYSYACNVLHPPGPVHYPQPGEDHGYNLPFNFNCIDVKVGARKDGLKNAEDGECPCGYIKVRLYLGTDVHPPGSPVDLGRDYHWYRQDSNGLWSSKHGGMPVGAQVNSPDADAHSWGYNVFCGTMCAPSH